MAFEDSADGSAPNCVIQYVPEAYRGDKRGVVGRQSAGAGFLDALIRYGGLERLYFTCGSPDHAIDFRQRVAQVDATIATEQVSLFDAAAMARIGSLFIAGPVVSEMAWVRRYIAAEAAYGLLGITHSIASDRVVRNLRDLMVAPTQPWDALICTSRCVHSAIQRVFDGWGDYLASRGFRGGLQPVMMPIIPLGVHTEAYVVSEGVTEQSQQLRQKMGVGPQDVVVLYYGRFDHRTKLHPSAMFRSVELARRRYRSGHIHLLMVGQFADGRTAEDFRQATALYCPSGPVHWIDGGDTDLARRAWSAADIFLSLSDNVQESFGMTPVEAMAAGLPCVVSDWNGYRDTIVDGETGFLVPTMMAPPGSGIDLADAFATRRLDQNAMNALVAQTTAVDIDAAAAAIARLAADPALRRTIGAAARRRAETVYHWRHVVSAYQDLWREQRARRMAQASIGARRPDTDTLHPDFVDPFTMFEHHATTVLAPSMRVVAAEADLDFALRRSRILGMERLADPIMLDEQHTRRILNELAAGPKTVEELAAASGINITPMFNRSLMRLYKFGLIRLAPPCQEALP